MASVKGRTAPKTKLHGVTIKATSFMVGSKEVALLGESVDWGFWLRAEIDIKPPRLCRLTPQAIDHVKAEITKWFADCGVEVEWEAKG